MKYSILTIILPLISSILLTGCSLPFIGGGRLAALNVTSNPKASIFLDGKHIGSTPYADEKLKPGEYSVKLIPEGGVAQPWEARIKLSPGILTVVSRELGDTPDRTSGYVLSLEPSDAKEKTTLLVVTNPDGTVISVDGNPRGFAPKAIEDIGAGEHTLLISTPGYLEKSLKARLVQGYKLTASVQLSKMPVNQVVSAEGQDEQTEETSTEPEDKALDEDIDATPTPKASATPKPSTTPKPSSTPAPSTSPKPSTKPSSTGTLEPPYVTVLDTPTGWLNVREKASTSSDILIKIDPGEQYEYLDTTTNGWIQIRLPDGQKGWVSGKYVEVTK